MANITPYQLTLYTSQVTDIYRALESEIFKQITKRLKTSQDVTKDNVLKWQMEQLQDLHLLNDSTMKLIVKATGLSKNKIEEAFKKAGIDTVKSVDTDVEGYFDAPLPLSSNLDNIIETYVKQVFVGNADMPGLNLVNQTLISTQYGSGAVMKIYENIVNETTAKVLAGQMTIQQALEETIINWANKGVQSTFIDKGGHSWSLERYVDTVLRSTVNRTYNELRMSRMSEYGTDLVLVSSHAQARPACSHAQGRVLTTNRERRGEYPSIYEFGYGTAAGLRGINCRHMFFPLFEGISTNNQPKFNPMEAQDNAKIQQGQREIERKIRRLKKDLMIAEELGSPSVEDREQAVLNAQAKMRAYVAENDLTRQYKREKVVTPIDTIIQKG